MRNEPTTAGGRERHLDDILAAYLEAAERGWAPDRQRFLALYPELAADLARFFANRDLIEPPAAPIPAAQPEGRGPWPDVPGYTTLGELGRGGMGVVFRARHEGLNRVVALKMVRERAWAGPVDLARFRAEAQNLARLQHPHIVQIFEVGQADGQPYLALEFVEGGSLADRLEGTPWPAAAAAALVETLAGAVHAAHGQNIIHRDLKPANVLLTADGRPKVSDFGLAKRLDGRREDPEFPAPGETVPHGGNLTQSGAVVGTPSYMAPEQAAGQGDQLGPATDVYGLGAILYELLTGRPPFKGATALDTLEQVRAQEPVPPSRFQPRLPRDLETITLKCLEKEPARRYPSARDLADDLRRFLEDRPIHARRAGRAERLRRWCRRNPLVALLGAALVLVGVLAFAGVTGLWLLAEDRGNRADAHWKELRLKHQEVLRHQQLLRAENARAETKFADARQAVSKWLVRFGGLKPWQMPQSELVVLQSAEDALRLYQGYLKEKPRDPGVRFETALAQGSAGILYRNLGKDEQAEQTLRRAVALLEGLAEESPRAPEYRNALAIHYNSLATVLDRRRPRDAEQLFRKALGFFEQLVPQCPDRLDYRASLANMHLSLGILLQKKGQPGPAEAAFDRALILYADLCRQAPGGPYWREGLVWARIRKGVFLVELPGRLAEARQTTGETWALAEALERDFPGRDLRPGLARIYNELGILLKKTGQPGEAERALRKGTALADRVVADFPHVPRYRDCLYVGLNALSNLLMPGKPQEAETVLQKNRANLEELVRQFPAEARYRSGLGAALHNLGTLHCRRGQTAQARPLYEAAIVHQRVALEKKPRHPIYRQFLRNHYVCLAETCLRTADHRTAAAMAAHLADLYPDSGEELYRSAHLVARCVPLAEKDQRLGPRAVPTAQTYAGRAVGLLARVHRTGYRNGGALKVDPAFTALRSHPDFRNLSADPADSSANSPAVPANSGRP